MVNEAKFSSAKDRKKRIRSVFQAVILLFLLFLILRALFSFREYKPYSEADRSDEDMGFIGISYFGVEREGDDTLISTTRLEEHLKALYDQGYVTVSQEDIRNYYESGKPLPKKALYLMFEDGRRDTAIFAQNIMEKYNFKATMMSYVERFEDQQTKFLGLDDLENLVDSSFWELGTNGYRLSYINVFDKEENYLGEMTSLEFNEQKKNLGRDYNHYLMDFIRDEDRVPKETRTEMKQRIAWDYQEMRRIYEESLGYVPQTYVLMHSNTGSFGNNDKVSAENERWIKELFTMNFNREGDCQNIRDSSVYDLTRMQPQSYWYTNHLLMRIKDDTGQKVTFVTGEEKKLSDWELLKGAGEYQKEKIIVTSEAKDKGLLRLKDSQSYEDFYFHTRLTGNLVGSQTVYFRADENLKQYAAVEVKDNILTISQSQGSGETELYTLNLDEFDGKEARTDIDIREAEERKLEITAKGNQLSVKIDGKEAVSGLDITGTGAGSIYLGSGWSDYGWSQRNLADDVYDGVFEDTYVMTKEEGGKLLYEGRYTGLEKAGFQAKQVWDHVINWFIKYL